MNNTTGYIGVCRYMATYKSGNKYMRFQFQSFKNGIRYRKMGRCLTDVLVYKFVYNLKCSCKII